MTEEQADTHPPEILKSETLESFLTYYSLLKNDLLLQTGSFKNHVRNSQIIVAAILSILTFLLTKDHLPFDKSTLPLWVSISFLLTTTTLYLIYDILEAVFAIRALEEGLAFLEEKINQILGSNQLIWQSGVANELWPNSFKDEKIIPPSIGLNVYYAIIALGATIALPSYIYTKSWYTLHRDDFWNYVLPILGIYSFLSVGMALFVGWKVNSRLRGKVRRMIDRRWGSPLAEASGSGEVPKGELG